MHVWIFLVHSLVCYIGLRLMVANILFLFHALIHQCGVANFLMCESVHMALALIQGFVYFESFIFL